MKKKGGEIFQSAVFISDINKIRPDGSTNGIDLFNSVSRASAYDAGHFVGYNSAQFATTYALSEGGGFLLNSIRSTPKISFYSVQGAEDVARLKAGGTPWPTSPTSAHFGEGLYTWGTRAEAEAYRDLLQKRWPELRLEIMEFKISKGSFNRLKKFEVPLDDNLANSWLNKHSSLFGSGKPHGFQYIKRNSGMGYEHYFNKNVFNRFKLK